MKKPTNPLPTDLRFGGALVLPILKAFERLSNVVAPGYLPLRAGLAEPLESWAIHAVHEMGVLRPSIWQQRISHTVRIYDLPSRGHFVPRLTEARVKSLIDRVLTNASAANADPTSEFTFDMIGLFGSVLRGAEAPGDVDVVFVAQFRDTEEIIPESDYYPFSRNLPDDRAAVILRRGARRSDLSFHDLREVKAIGAAYQVIWTRKEGRVERPITEATAPEPDLTKEGEDGILRTNAKCEAFRMACLNSLPLPLPVQPQIPSGTRAMTFQEWADALNKWELVPLLAHHYCLPPGAVKECAADLITEWRKSQPQRVAEAERQLFPFLAASVQFGTWKWDDGLGLIEGKPYPKRVLFGS